MLKKTGIFVIIGVLALFIGLHFASIPDGQTTNITIATMLGGITFLCMTCGVILTTRLNFLENWFGGLDRMYQVHRFIGISVAILAIVHWFSAPEEFPAGTDLEANSLIPSEPLAIIGMLLMIIGIFAALNKKLAYSKWRPMHRFMALVYVILIAHFMTTPPVFVNKSSPDIIMLIIFAVIGVIAAIYTLFGMNKRVSYDYVVKEVIPMERATAVDLEPKGAAMKYQAGQFAFVEVEGEDWDEPHPFTISSGPAEHDLRFTMKVLGDWTRKVRAELKPGQKVKVHGPYGRFDTKDGKKKQVWIAGGIGITPFLSSLRAMEKGDPREIALAYAVRCKDEALYLDEMEAKAKELGNVRIVTLFSDEGDFVTVDKLQENLPGSLEDYSYFLCGPPPMVDALLKGFKEKGVKRSDIYYEAFAFR